MNDLVSEYQQYQDATTEGKLWLFGDNLMYFISVFVEEGEGLEAEEEQE